MVLVVIEGSAELTSYASRMVSGSLSDITRKRKVFVLPGYGFRQLASPFLWWPVTGLTLLLLGPQIGWARG